MQALHIVPDDEGRGVHRDLLLVHLRLRQAACTRRPKAGSGAADAPIETPIPEGSQSSEPVLRSFPARHGPGLGDRRQNIVYQRLGHALAAPRSDTGPHPARRYRRFFASHGWQHVVAGGQAHEESEWDEPDADAEVGGNLGEGWDVGWGIVVGGHVHMRPLLGL